MKYLIMLLFVAGCSLSHEPDDPIVLDRAPLCDDIDDIRTMALSAADCSLEELPECPLPYSDSECHEGALESCLRTLDSAVVARNCIYIGDWPYNCPVFVANCL